MATKIIDPSRAGPEVADVDGDEALRAVDAAGGALEVDGATNSRLVRKIDMMIMPVCCV